ncbi:MAG: LytR C-terminal domain-containing protein [Gordonia sp. (in: high G+C Gram-positive bacteria)]|uniref:LytR C-terminal domain-containing protein n=1 Tax=Gordonia sp. (in: high G+C Gram-positive bacteria) TaxID=84139 RepID=UPI003C789BBC
MNADRETNRLPLRAGAMLLLAIAVVCLGLGIHQLTLKDSAPDAGLIAAESSQASAEASAGSPTAAASDTATTSPSPTVDPNATELCVLNAGSITGLAGEVGDALTSAGYKVGEKANLASASITENTIFYTADQEAEAKKVAESVPGGAALTARPDQFTRCPGAIAVVVVSR